MVRPLVLLFFFTAIAAQAQPERGCELTEWTKSIPANANATPERNANLRDTTVLIKGQQRTIQLPQGFTLREYAQIGGARGVALSPDGVIFVTGREGGGRVYALPDGDRNGSPDSVVMVRSGLGGSIHGIGFIRGELYVSTDSRFMRLRSTDGDREFEEMEVIANFEAGGHSTRTFVYDTIRRKVYIQVGSVCNVCEETNPERATIVEMNLDGTQRRVYASGIRNAVGLDFDPRTGALWANSNDADNIFGQGHPGTNDNPKEPVFIVCDGANYGWPYAYGTRMRIPIAPSHVDTTVVQSFSAPIAGLLAHSAPLGMRFLRGKAFPSRYQGALIQSYHGSWNRTPPAPPRVTTMWADTNGQNAILEDLVTGFQFENGSRWGRPVAVTEGADGALYVTDDHASVVYRIAYTGVAGKSIGFGVPGWEGARLVHGEHIHLTWNASGVDNFRVLFRRTSTSIPDTLGFTSSKMFMWEAPDVTTNSASFRIESVDWHVQHSRLRRLGCCILRALRCFTVDHTESGAVTASRDRERVLRQS
jgi:glucose/arabinose dehydrogenase